MKKIKVIFIDSVNKKISEEEIEPTLAEYYRLIGCDMVESVFLAPGAIGRNNVLFVDKEGLLKGPKHFFKIGNYHDPLAGNAILFGIDGENEIGFHEFRTGETGSLLMHLHRTVKFLELP